MTLLDRFQRQIDYLRLSVTDRCDLRCTYCLPKDYRAQGEPANWLDAQQLQRLIGAFVQLGVGRIRLTGGEPLVRRGLLDIVNAIAAIPGVKDLSLSTNGVRLASKAGKLAQAGVSRLNISLDTLDPEQYRRLTGGHLHKVIEGLDAASEAGMAPIKINCVMMRDVNDHEAENLLEFCMQRGFTLRFIETMPVGAQGQNALQHYIDLSEVRAGLAKRFELIPDIPPAGAGPARYYRVGHTGTHIGFITPMSQHFCESCNRVRLGPDGMLYLCLGQEEKVDLGAAVRAGADVQELRCLIQEAVLLKPERHEFTNRPEQVVRFMGVTGG